MSDEERLLVDPNAADVEILIQLPGVGEALARRIQDARPFLDADDLLRVPGLGKATLGKMSPHLVFRSEEAQLERADEPEERIDKEEIRTQETPKAKPKSGRPVRAAGRKVSFWFTLTTIVSSIILSILLVLAILGGINRTLDIGQHRAVRQLSNDLAGLRTDFAGISSRMDAINRRMEVIEGLSGRVKSVESEFSTIREDVTLSLSEIESSLNLMDDLAGEVQALSESVNRFDIFVEGLRQLLMDPSILTEPEPVPQP